MPPQGFAAADDRADSTDVRSRRGLLTALGAIALVWLIAVSRWASSDSVVPWDSKNQFYVFFRFLAESLHAGTGIFWNPYHYGGHPSVADPQSLIFTPPFLLWAWFDRAPSLWTFDLLVMAHLLAGGLAIGGFGWRRGWTTPACVIAATVFMLGGAASSRLNHTGIVLCYGLFPLAVLTMEVALARRSVLLTVAFTAIAATIVLGRNQVALLLSAVLVILLVREIAMATAPIRYLRARLHLIGLMAGLGVALTAVPILLTLQLAALSNRPVATLSSALESSLYPANLATLAVPNVFGSHETEFSYWGPNYTILPQVGATDDSFNYMFVGALPVLLLIWLGVAGGGLFRRGNRTLTAVLALALFYSIGRYSPLFPWIFDHAPVVDFFRRPIDGVFIIGVVIALVSGQLINEYVKRGLPRVHPLMIAIALAGATVVLASAISVSALTGHAHRAATEILKALIIVGLLSFVLARPSNQRQRAIAASLVAAATAIELVAWNAASRMNAEGISYYRVLEQASADDAAALRLLREELDDRHAEGRRPRIEVVGLGGPWQNLAVVLGMEATNGYNPLRIGIYDRYVAPGEQNFAISQRQFPPTFSGYDCALARAIGLEYIVLDRPIEEFRQLKRPEHIQTLRAGPSVWIYRLPEAEPRVRFSSRVQIANVDATLMNGDLRNPPVSDRIVVDTQTPPRRLHPGAPEPAGRARITSWAPGRIVVDVQARSEGVLVLHDIYYPGWIAEVDGVKSPILRADVVFRAVEVPEGRHRVEFRFEPLAFDNLVAAVRQLTKPPEAAAPETAPSIVPPSPIEEELIASARRRAVGPKTSARQSFSPLSR